MFIPPIPQADRHELPNPHLFYLFPELKTTPFLATDQTLPTSLEQFSRLEKGIKYKWMPIYKPSRDKPLSRVRITTIKSQRGTGGLRDGEV
jgi:hypothetical protein